jgi:hypothetical protein
MNHMYLQTTIAVRPILIANSADIDTTEPHRTPCEVNEELRTVLRR